MRRIRTLAVAVAAASAALTGPAAPAASSGWTAVPVPRGGLSATLLGASAPSDTDAWAVGSVASGQTLVSDRPLIEHWDGTAWTVQPSPTNTGGSLFTAAAGSLGASTGWAVGWTGASTAPAPFAAENG